MWGFCCCRSFVFFILQLWNNNNCNDNDNKDDNNNNNNNKHELEMFRISEIQSDVFHNVLDFAKRISTSIRIFVSSREEFRAISPLNFGPPLTLCMGACAFITPLAKPLHIATRHCGVVVTALNSELGDWRSIPSRTTTQGVKIIGEKVLPLHQHQ